MRYIFGSGFKWRLGGLGSPAVTESSVTSIDAHSSRSLNQSDHF